MIESVFRDFLLMPNDLALLVGDRVFQDRAPQNALPPMLILRKLRSESTHTQTDFVPGHATTRYRVLVAAASFTDLIQLRNEIKGLDGYSIANATAAGLDTSFNTAFTILQSAMVVFETDQFQEASQLFQLTMDWELMHTDTYPPGLIPTPNDTKALTE